MKKLFKRLFKKEEQESKFPSKTWLIENEETVFNVDEFNKWFCDPHNNAEYSHIGIYLRTDKLSQSMVMDYLLKKYGLENGAFLFSKPYTTMIINFTNEIYNDWMSKIK